MSKSQRFARRQNRKLEDEIRSLRQQVGRLEHNLGVNQMLLDSCNRANARLSQKFMQIHYGLGKDGEFHLSMKINERMAEEFRYEPAAMAAMVGRWAAQEIKLASYNRVGLSEEISLRKCQNKER